MPERILWQQTHNTSRQGATYVNLIIIISIYNLIVIRLQMVYNK